MLSSFAAFAATSAAADTSVGISGLTAGDVVAFYQVLTWNQTEGAYRLTDGFAGLRSSTAFATTLTGSEDGYAAKRDAEIVKLITDNSGLTQAQASAIAAYAATASKVGSDITVAGEATSVTYELPKTNDVVNSDALGLYMGVITAGNPGYVYNPVFVGADYNTTTTTPSIAVTDTYENNGIAKKKEIDVTKTTSDSNESLQQAINSYVGEEVEFQVKTTIPVFLESYTQPSFRIDDVIKTAGIELVTGSVKVTLGETKYTDYTVTDTFVVTETTKENETAKTGYNVVFDAKYLKANATAVDVTIDYKGKITNTAEFNINEDQNEVTVTYSNGPTNEKAALRDRTSHYTFSIGAKALGQTEDSGKTWELVKVAADKDGNPVVEEREVSSWSTKEKAHPLAGATFGLYSDSGATTLYTNDLYPDGATFETTADGVITFKGLSEGTYYMKEISAPTGYVKDERIVQIDIECEYDDVHVDETTEGDIKVAAYDYKVLKSYTVKVNNVSVYTEQNKYAKTESVVQSNYTFNNDGEKVTEIKNDTVVRESDLVNTPGVELPSTGGMGTTILYVGGSILVILAAILLITKRRMNAED